MSFLDATGLGTFWGKLKNYFVPKTAFQNPVSEDLMDMIVPENLVPDSLFSNLNTSIMTITDKTYDNLTATQNVNISKTALYEWYLTVHHISISETTVSKSGDGLSVSFKLNEIGDNALVGFRTVDLVKGSYSALTKGGDLVSISHSDLQFAPYNALTESTMYTDAGGSEAKRYTKVSSVKCFTVGIRGFTNSHIGETISFTFRNPFFYRGAFKKPTYVESGDKASSCRYVVPWLANVEYIWKRVTLAMNGTHNFGITTCHESGVIYVAYASGTQNLYKPNINNIEVYKVDFRYWYNSTKDKNNKRTWIGEIKVKCITAMYNTVDDNYVKYFNFRNSTSGTVWLNVNINDSAETGTLLILEAEPLIYKGTRFNSSVSSAVGTNLDSGTDTNAGGVGHIAPDFSGLTFVKMT